MSIVSCPDSYVTACGGVVLITTSTRRNVAVLKLRRHSHDKASSKLAIDVLCYNVEDVLLRLVKGNDSLFLLPGPWELVVWQHL